MRLINCASAFCTKICHWHVPKGITIQIILSHIWYKNDIVPILYLLETFFFLGYFKTNKTMSQFLAQVISVTVKVKRGHFLRFWANKWQDVMTAWKWNIYVVTLRVCIAVRYIILASFWMKQHITEKVLLPSQWWWWSDPQIEYRKCIKKKIEMYSEISQVSHASLPLLLA